MNTVSNGSYNFLNSYEQWEEEIQGPRSGSNPEKNNSREGLGLYLPAYVMLKQPDKFLKNFPSFSNANSEKARPDKSLLGVRIEAHERWILASYIERLGSNHANLCVVVMLSLDKYAPSGTLDTTLLDTHFTILQLGALVSKVTESPRLVKAPDEQKDEKSPAVLAGIIDDGIGFLNRRFCRKTDGSISTRFDSVWIQSVLKGNHEHLWSGEVIYRAEINEMLNGSYEPDAYQKINNRVYGTNGEFHYSTALMYTHGTQIADLACGANPSADSNISSNDSTADGIGAIAICNNVDIVGVSLPPSSIIDTAGIRLDMHVLQGLRWILYRGLMQGDNSPDVVVNISLGISAGPKDGTGFLEGAIQRELATYELATGRVANVVLAFGNDYLNRQIAILDDSPGVESTSDMTDFVYWRVLPDDRSSSYIELRAIDTTLVAQQFSFSLTAPDGITKYECHVSSTVKARVESKDQILRIFPGSSDYIMLDGQPVGKIFAEASDTNGRVSCTIALAPTVKLNSTRSPALTAPAGKWVIKLISIQDTEVPLPQKISIQVQRGDTPAGYRRFGRQSYLDHPASGQFDRAVTRNYSEIALPITHTGTHSALVSDDSRVTSVGATYARREKITDSYPSPTRYTGQGSAGETRIITNKSGPRVSAPGDIAPNSPGILSSGTKSGSTGRIRGTSAAAAIVTRNKLLELLPDQDIGVAAKQVAPSESIRMGDRWLKLSNDRILRDYSI